MSKARIAELERIIAVDEAKVAREAAEQNVPLDCTCGTCGKAFGYLYPSARCPFEYVHAEIEELRRLKQGRSAKADTLPTLLELLKAKLDFAGPRDKTITIKITINTARMIYERERATHEALRLTT